MNIKNNKITTKEEEFAQWYTDVCFQAGLFDYGPTKGTIIFKPYGYAIWENITNFLNQEFKKLGVNNVYFPMLIPKQNFDKEKDHLEGFSPELATVTKVGDKKLSEDLYIRPTSEVLMCEHFSREVKSYRDLPLKYNQWCSVIRWEKNTRPFLRSSEFLWQEGHTIHESEKEAQTFFKKILDIYKNLIINKLNIIPILGEKSEHEKFAGAINTLSIETIMQDGKALQSGTSHYFGDKFSKIFNIKYEDKNQKQAYPFSTSWGVSTRLIGALVMSHGDNYGLVLPWEIAPHQIALILAPKPSKELEEHANDIFNKLNIKYRIEYIKSIKSFGFDIVKQEIKGVPIRLELGKRDFENKTITIVNRYDRTKKIISIEELDESLFQEIKTYTQNLKDHSQKIINKYTKNASTLDEVKNYFNENNYLFLLPFCGLEKCELEIKEKLNCVSRCTPLEQEKLNYKCINCQNICNKRFYFAKSY